MQTKPPYPDHSKTPEYAGTQTIHGPGCTQNIRIRIQTENPDPQPRMPGVGSVKFVPFITQADTFQIESLYAQASRHYSTV